MTTSEPSPAPDRPRVPRPRRSRALRAYAWFGAAVSAGLVGANATGIGIDQATAREQISPSVRASPGGYRSYHFWHDGYNGGK